MATALTLGIIRTFAVLLGKGCSEVTQGKKPLPHS